MSKNVWNRNTFNTLQSVGMKYLQLWNITGKVTIMCLFVHTTKKFCTNYYWALHYRYNYIAKVCL